MMETIRKTLRCMIWICILCMASGVCISCTRSSEPTVFEIKQGVNIGCWLSQSNITDERRKQIFNEEDIDLLVKAGFDHIRLPVDEVQLFNEDMSLNEETLSILHNTIDNCLKRGLKVVFDLHIIRSHHFLDEHAALWSNVAEQDKLVDMWRVIQQQLYCYPVTEVAYELLNEAVAPDDEQWAALMLRIVEMIREKEHDRVIVLGANMQNNAAHVKNIRVPQDDRNIMLSFHFYEPLLITHYQALWTPLRILNFSKPMQYPGQLIPDDLYAELSDEEKEVVEPYHHSYDKDWIRSYWSEAIEYAKQKGLKLYLGEFGCLVNCGEEVRMAWLKDVVDVAREQGIAYSLWEYNQQFGFADRWNKGVITNNDLMKVVTQ
jgi:endoglucanase